MRVCRWVLVLMVCLISFSSAWGDERRSCRSARLSGVWVITFNMTEKPDFLPETITLLGNFTKDGNFIFSTDMPTLEVPVPYGGTEPVTVGEGHGVWKRMGFGKYRLQSTALVKLALEPESLIGFGGGGADFELNPMGYEINGTVRLQLKPLAGDPLPPGMGKVVGRRLFQ